MMKLKWILIVLCLLALSPSLAGVVFSLIVNPIVSSELRNNPNGKEAREAMLLTFEGRTLPVNYRVVRQKNIDEKSGKGSENTSVR